MSSASMHSTVALYFQATNGTLAMWSYTAGGLKIKV